MPRMMGPSGGSVTGNSPARAGAGASNRQSGAASTRANWCKPFLAVMGGLRVGLLAGDVAPGMADGQADGSRVTGGRTAAPGRARGGKVVGVEWGEIRV